MRLTACLIVGAGLLLTCWAFADDAKSDQDVLQGTWETDSYEINGEAIKGKMTLVFSGKKFRLLLEGLDKRETVIQGTFTLDERKSPKQIDFKVTSDPSIGIYEVTKDTLKVCWGPSSRPTKFTSGASHTYATYNRVVK